MAGTVRVPAMRLFQVDAFADRPLTGNPADVAPGWLRQQTGFDQPLDLTLHIRPLDTTRMIRALNRIGYDGPLSIEWEDSGMDRDWGAPDALAFVRRTDFAPSQIAFDAAMQR